jgi:hypothetical protein
VSREIKKPLLWIRYRMSQFFLVVLKQEKHTHKRKVLTSIASAEFLKHTSITHRSKKKFQNNNRFIFNNSSDAANKKKE